jgi:hypothetical protein
VQPPVGHAHAVAVAGAVVVYLLGVAESGLSVDHPVGGGERFEHRLEFARAGEALELPGAPRAVPLGDRHGGVELMGRVGTPQHMDAAELANPCPRLGRGVGLLI